MDGNEEFVDSLKVYLRTAMKSTTPVPSAFSALPALPARPTVPLPKRALEQRVPNPEEPAARVSRNTWATVARTGLKHNPGPTKQKAAPSTPKPKPKEKNNNSTVDKRLFVRLEECKDSACKSELLLYFDVISIFIFPAYISFFYPLGISDYKRDYVIIIQQQSKP